MSARKAATRKTPADAELVNFPIPETKDDLAEEIRAIEAADAAGLLSKAERQERIVRFFGRFICAVAAQQRGIKPRSRRARRQSLVSATVLPLPPREVRS